MKQNILLLLFLLLSTNLFANDKTDLIKQYPVFSLTKYEKERAMVWKHIHHPNVTKSSKAYLSLHDLDGDGIDEILAYLESYRTCGRKTGCHLYILTHSGSKLEAVGF